MTRRIVLGKDSGGTYGLKVSKEGQDAYSASGLICFLTLVIKVVMVDTFKLCMHAPWVQA